MWFFAIVEAVCKFSESMARPALVSAIVLLGNTANAAEAWLVNANKLTLEYRQKLDTLAKWCDEHELPEEAAKIRLCVPPQDEEKIYIPKLPIKVLRPTATNQNGSARSKPEAKRTAIVANIPTQKTSEIPPETDDSRESEDEDENGPEESPDTLDQKSKEDAAFDWEAEFWKARRTYAAKLFACAKSAARQDRGSLAIQMSLMALHADPDHAAIRKLLGFIRYKDEWRTPWEREQLKKGRIDHPKFGWMPEKFVKRYEDGERWYGKKWITPAEDRHNRQEIRKGWQIETEHYLLTTNHSLEEGVRLTRELEDLYRAWKLLFYRFMASDEGLATLFEGKTTPKPGMKHNIRVFRDRQDYLANLILEKPREAPRYLAQTIGLYEPGERQCTFFSFDKTAHREVREEVHRTLLHEATHQLFSESRRGGNQIAVNGNFWIIEGIAMYMETLDSEQGYYVVGGTEDARFQDAIDEVFNKSFYVPLGRFTLVDRLEFQNFPDLQKVYSQSAGMAHFFMHAESGSLRDAAVAYLQLIYDGKDKANTLSTLTKKPYPALDELYLDYLDARRK